VTRPFVHNQLRAEDILILAERTTKKVVSTTLIIGITRHFSDMTTQLLTTYASSESELRYSELTHSGSQRVIHRNSANTLTIIRAGEVLYQST